MFNISITDCRLAALAGNNTIHYFMKKIQKKELRVAVETAMAQALLTLQIQEPSRKTKKVINKVSKTVFTEVKRVLDKRSRREDRAAKASTKTKNGKASKKAELSAKLIEA